MGAEVVVLLLSLVFFVWVASAWEAFLQLSWGRVRRLESKDSQLAREVEVWLNHQKPYEVVFRILVFFSISIVASLVFAVLDHWADFRGWSLLPHALAAGLVTLLLVGLFTVFARSLVFRFDIQVLRVTIPLVKVLSLSLFYPVVEMVLFVRGRIEGAQLDEEEEKTTTEDEIMSLIEMDGGSDDEANGLEEEEREMIRGIFDLDDTLVREVMTPRVDAVALPADASVEEAVAKFNESGHSRLPIYQDNVDEIKGVIMAKDFLDQRKTAGKSLEQLCHKPLYVPESKAVGELLRDFLNARNHFSVVVDEYGGTAGIITLEDILELIVGDIHDEHETGEDSSPVATRDGAFVMDARTLVGEASELLGVKIPEDEDYETIGGYVCGKLGKIPEAGEEAIVDGLIKVTVLKADRRRVLTLQVKPLDCAGAKGDE